MNLGRSGAYDRRLAFDPSIMAEAATLNLAKCHVRLGDLNRAEFCFQQVLGLPAYQKQGQEGLDLVQKLRHQASAGGTIN